MIPQPEPDAPPLPRINWPRLKIFLLGALWVTVTALAPIAMLIYDWLSRWDDPLDWTMIVHQAISLVALALFGYWRKYKAWLMAPPPK